MVHFYRHFPITWQLSSADMADSCLISLKWRVQPPTLPQLLFTLNGLAQSTVKTEKLDGSKSAYS
jgi:hypothetical protein